MEKGDTVIVKDPKILGRSYHETERVEGLVVNIMNSGLVFIQTDDQVYHVLPDYDLLVVKDDVIREGDTVIVTDASELAHSFENDFLKGKTLKGEVVSYFEDGASLNHYQTPVLDVDFGSAKQLISISNVKKDKGEK
ncbi:MAG: hypothetical protein ACOCQD_03670 [archaeon]